MAGMCQLQGNCSSSIAHLWKESPSDSADQMCESDQEVAIADDEMSDRMP